MRDEASMCYHDGDYGDDDDVMWMIIYGVIITHHNNVMHVHNGLAIYILTSHQHPMASIAIQQNWIDILERELKES